MMKRFFSLFYLCILWAISLSAQPSADVCTKYNTLNRQIRDQSLNKAEEKKQFINLLQPLEQYYLQKTGKSIKIEKWCFPIAGYNASASGGKNGNGYIASGYDFYAGNKHGGHPAHDIFIRDTNQDGIDDKTGKEVNVLSASEGIIIATETNWQPGSDQKGGNYIWIYNPAQRRFFYYAHNNKVLVKPGDAVSAGTPIATVGRTGVNAYKKRSPTHLHFMVLKLDGENYPRPENTYDLLKSN